MNNVDDKDLLEVNWLGYSEPAIQDICGVDNTDRRVAFIDVGMPGITGAIAMPHLINGIDEVMTVPLEHLKNEKESQSSKHVISLDCKEMYNYQIMSNEKYRYIRDTMMLVDGIYDRINLDKKLSSSMMIQKIKQYCAQHQLIVIPSKINSCMQHAKKHGYYFSNDLK